MFRNRRDAGQQLALKLGHLAHEHPVVLGLPRGGVPVAAEVAEALHSELDIIGVRKLGVPHQPEVAMGAIGEAGVRVLDERLIALANIPDEDVAEVEANEREVLAQRLQKFRAVRPRVDLTNRVAIIVDDGIATGATAAVACEIAKRLGARKVVLAVPVAPPEALEASAADEVVAVLTPRTFRAVGMHYLDFGQTPDEEVVEILGTSFAKLG